MKDDTPGLVKFATLKRLLAVDRLQVIGVLESLWLFVRKNCPLGDVGRFSNEEIAAGIEWLGDADHLVASLTNSKWLDHALPQYRFVCHDWPDNAPTFIVRRIAKALGMPDTRTATPSLVAAWRLKMFGREKPPDSPDLGARVPGASPAGAQNGVKTAALARAREPNPTQPNPTTPAAPERGAPSEPGPDAEQIGISWESLSSELKGEGMDLAEAACRTAKQNGNLPNEVSFLLNHWRRNRPAWPIGTLYNKICGMRPGLKVNWPDLPPSAEPVPSRADLERSQKKTAAMSKNSAATRAKNKAADEARQKKYGPILDAMDPDECAAILEKLKLSKAPAGMQRDQLLLELERQATR